MPVLSVCLTCFNRREKTLACLRALAACRLPTLIVLKIVLVDDGSTDGTADAVRREFPSTEIMRGTGALYWNGGMRVAFGRAMELDAQDHLWLNDDTLLDSDALERLFACRETLGLASPAHASIIVGATRDAGSGALTYGGLRDVGHALSHRFAKLPVSDRPQPCLTFNGNCVLVAGAAARVLGNLDESFVHGIGDWDYGLRARQAGIGVWQAPGFVGTCSHNEPAGLAPRTSCSMRARLRHVCGPKQLPPRSWYVYVRRHFPVLWPAYFVRPYLAALARAWQARAGRTG